MILESNANISDVIDWEKERNLPFENMTIRERVFRKLSYEYPDKSEALATLNVLESIRNKSDSVSPTKITSNDYKYDLEVLTKRKDNSEFSNRMYLAVRNYMEAMDIFDSIARRSIVVLDKDSRSFINRLAMCYKLEHFVGTMPIEIHE
ncbi:hypothetical protein BGZ90_009763, partial [Linnemannia elongata]